MAENSEAPRPGFINRTVQAIKNWGYNVKEDAKAMPGTIKDLGSIAAQSPVMPPAENRANDWREPVSTLTPLAAPTIHEEAQKSPQSGPQTPTAK